MRTTTLPDLPTLEDIEDLTATKLYRTEIMHLPLLNPEMEQDLIERARQGEVAAREELLLGCLRSAWFKAWSVYRGRRPQHLDALDLIAVANLAMLEAFDRALAAPSPIGYLVGVAESSMHRECTYHAPLIQKPEQTMARLAKTDPHPATVESFEAWCARSKRARFNHAPFLTVAPLDEQRMYRRFAPLYAAVKRLPPRQQTVMIRLYGFFDHPSETTEEIGQTEGILPRTVSNHGFLARQHLRTWLAADLRTMVRPKPQPEEPCQ